MTIKDLSEKLFSPYHRKRKEAGFALMDALVAAALVAIGVVTIMKITSGSAALIQYQVKWQKATLVLTALMERQQAMASTSPSTMPTAWTNVSTFFNDTAREGNYSAFEYKYTVPATGAGDMNAVGQMDALNLTAPATGTNPVAETFQITVRFNHKGTYREISANGIWARRW